MPVEQPLPQPCGNASEILRSLLKRLRELPVTALESALCIISTVLDRCPIPVLRCERAATPLATCLRLTLWLRMLDEQIGPLLRVEKDVAWIAEALRTASPSLSERIVEFVAMIVPCMPYSFTHV